MFTFSCTIFLSDRQYVTRILIQPYRGLEALSVSLDLVLERSLDAGAGRDRTLTDPQIPAASRDTCVIMVMAHAHLTHLSMHQPSSIMSVVRVTGHDLMLNMSQVMSHVSVRGVQ